MCLSLAVTTDDEADNEAGFMNPHSDSAAATTLQLAGLIGLLTLPSQAQSSVLPGKIGFDSQAPRIYI